MDQVFKLPSFGDAETEQEWLVKVAETVMSLKLENVTELWHIAKQAVKSMGDVFYDADDHGNSCYGCHKEDACPYAVGLASSYIPSRVQKTECRLWYGECGDERLFSHVAAKVLEAILLGVQKV